MDALRLELIPVELQKKVVSFLSIKDAFKLARLSKSLHKALNLSTVHLPDPISSSQLWLGGVDGGALPSHGISIPLLMKNRLHSVILRCRWHDQGWGNRKGQVYIVAARRGNPKGRVAFASPVAPHSEADLTMEIAVHEADSYYLWYKVGESGHELHIRDLTVQLVLHDRPGIHLAKNFNAMRSQGALRYERDFHFRILQVVTQSLLDQIEENRPPDINLANFFEAAGIAVNKQSLEALLELSNSLVFYGCRQPIEVLDGPNIVIESPPISEIPEPAAQRNVLGNVMDEMLQQEEENEMQRNVVGDFDDDLMELLGVGMEDLAREERRRMQP